MAMLGDDHEIIDAGNEAPWASEAQRLLDGMIGMGDPYQLLYLADHEQYLTWLAALNDRRDAINAKTTPQAKRLKAQNEN
jgi:hypothetical protein